ncbi:Hypothetical protein PHPALM_5471 [Phytophthora palmivora]|uniref:Helicase-associated domain-containing protein n=1 Tax=Phytophthora palmivora TaxID=4796 RepID=A0A2P4YHB5_9STRA|nr:Hypothetical protein PHPALM_5471 [Phytophthora palmivora]
MLRLVAARCRAAAPRSLVCVSTPSVQCKVVSVRFSSSDSTSYIVPNRVVASSAAVWRKTVSPALRTFVKLRGHAMVPTFFVVPREDDKWPEKTRGYPLGKHAEWLRRRWRQMKLLPEFALQDLEEIHFAFDISQYKWDRFVKPALRRYYELNGHTDVQQTFRVPHGDAAWSETLWGYYLGPRVFNIRHRGDFSSQIRQDAEEMAEINFCYDTTTYDRDWRERALPSLQIYRQEFGHCDVHRSFKVPDCPPWPKAAAGMLLGVTVNNIRSKGYYAEQVARDDAELKKIEFVWDHSSTEWNNRIFAALEAYVRVRGNCHISKDFVVPSTELWPEKAHGLKLGIAIKNIRAYAYYFDQIARNVDRLASLGFIVRIPQGKWHQRVEPMLETFEELHRHRDVPRDFIVPSETPWKERDRGIQLGKLELKETWV